MERLRVRVHYDFASALCYVAHRVMARMEPTLESLGIELRWTPIDLTRLVVPLQRGVSIPAERRANAERVAAELGVRVRVPRVWPDSRHLGGAALVAARLGRETSWRERGFSALFEEGRDVESPEAVLELARDLDLPLASEELERASGAVRTHTRAARAEMVTGVPTFMLGRWPFGGIQEEATMRHVLERFARKARAGELA